MKWINRDKLTDYDTQVLTLTGLLGADWRFKQDGMAHFEVGEFKKALYGFGMQVTELAAGTTRYRRLSWRGQILLRCEYRRMLVSKLPAWPEAQVFTVGGGIAAAAANPFGPLGSVAQQSALQQQQMQQAQQANLQNLQARFAYEMRVDLAKLQKETIVAARDDRLDAMNYSLYIRGAERPEPSLLAKINNFI